MAKSILPAVSPAETEVLRIVWEARQATVQDVCDKLASQRKRKVAYATVQTLLRRLEKKGYLKHRAKGKAHLFHAAVKREDVIRRTVGDFLDRLFGGDAVPLVQYLAQHGQIDADDIDNLKKLITEK
ncbi:MAG: BlaI/MecI/CopY family transcriptional regulator [Planctomycetota bacterium]|jgi:predicted transcriptional regulator